MSYMRGDPYIYSTGETIEIYSSGGAHLSLDMDTFDALVVMRMAQLIETQENFEAFLAEVAQRYAGNFGADALRKMLGRPTAMDYIRALVAKREEVAGD